MRNLFILVFVCFTFLGSKAQKLPDYGHLKSTAALEQKLDSSRLVSAGTILSKDEYIYDQLGRLTENIMYVHSAKTGLTKYRKYNFGYDGQNRLLFDESWRMNDSLTAWIYPTRNDYVYVADNLVTRKEKSWWITATGGSERLHKAEFQYNQNGKLIRENYYSFEGKDQLGADIYKHLQQTDYTYNAKGQKESAIQYEVGQTLINESKIVFEYNEAGQPSLWQYNYWDDASKAWTLSQKKLFEYDTNGRFVKISESYWNFSLSAFVVSREETFVYNPQGKITEYREAGLNFQTGKLENAYQHQYAYAADGDVTDYSRYKWVAAGEKWEIEERYDYSYDKNVSNEKIALAEALARPVIVLIQDENYFFTERNDIQCSHKLLKTDIKTYNNGVLAETQELQMFYSPFVQSVTSKPLVGKWNLYPNPASERITISWDAPDDNLRLSIFSQMGVLVRDQLVYNRTAVPVDDLATGLYVYRLTGRSGVLHEGKLLIRHP